MDMLFGDFDVVDSEKEIGLNSSNSSDYNNLLNTNFTDDTFKNLCETSEDIVVNWSMLVVRILVCVLGIFGNLMVFFVMLVLGEYKKAVTHWYVLQLAIADIAFLLTLPFKMVEDTHGGWVFSSQMCKFKETVLFLNYFSSVLFLMVMSIDRYIAVCHGLSTKLQKFRTKRSSYIITFIVWSTSLILCIPIILYSQKSGIEPRCTCIYEFPQEETTTAEEECLYETQHFSNESLTDCIERKESQSKEFCKKIECNKIADLFRLTMFKSDIPVFANSSTINETNINTSELTELAYNETITATQPEFNVGCSYRNAGQTFESYLIFNFVSMFVLPLLILTTCYSLIALKLRQTNIQRQRSMSESTSSTGHEQNGNQRRKRLTSASTEKERKNRLRVTYICFFLVLLFVVCWLPFHVVHLAKIRGVSSTTQFCSDIATVSSIIAYLNSALNPYIYNFTGNKFRKRLRTAVTSVKRSTKNRTSSASSGGGTVRYVNRKRTSEKTSCSDSMPMVKLYKCKNKSKPVKNQEKCLKQETQTLV